MKVVFNKLVTIDVEKIEHLPVFVNKIQFKYVFVAFDDINIIQCIYIFFYCIKLSLRMNTIMTSINKHI